MKTIIAISREFGSGGRFIGETLAKELNFTFYDKNIIKQVAKETGFSKEYIAERGEYAPTHNRFSYAFGSILGYETCMELIKKVWNKSILLHIPDRLQAPEARASQFRPSEAPRMLC